MKAITTRRSIQSFVLALCFSLAASFSYALPTYGCSSPSPDQSVVEATQTYLNAWSFEDSLDWDAFRSVFMPGENAVLMVEDFGDEVTILNSVDAYIETWEPVVLKVWRTLSVSAEDLAVLADENLAVSNFVLVANGQQLDGSRLTLKQRAMLVWQKNEACEWRVIREQLTTLPA